MVAAVVATTESAIDESVDQVEGEEPTLTELEEVILDLRKRVGQQMVEILVEKQEARQLLRPLSKRSFSPWMSNSG
jgi:chemotaxis regulatin CheY-phosphate phosphatase CheZ